MLVRQDSEYQGAQGLVNVSTLAQDYKPVDGIKYPHLLKLKFSVGGQTFEFNMNVTDVKHEVKIDDAKFAKPAA